LPACLVLAKFHLSLMSLDCLFFSCIQAIGYGVASAALHLLYVFLIQRSIGSNDFVGIFSCVCLVFQFILIVLSLLLCRLVPRCCSIDRSTFLCACLVQRFPQTPSSSAVHCVADASWSFSRGCRICLLMRLLSPTRRFHHCLIAEHRWAQAATRASTMSSPVFQGQFVFAWKDLFVEQIVL